MDKDQLINKLNFFYTLELNQVDLYTAQSKSFKSKDHLHSIFFERIAYIEQQHVDNIAEKIKELGSKPTSLGDVLAPIVGGIAGQAMGLLGFKNALKLNILLEQKAISDYNLLIAKLEIDQSSKELVKLLQFNLIDESLHAAWFKEELSKLNKGTPN